MLSGDNGQVSMIRGALRLVKRFTCLVARYWEWFVDCVGESEGEDDPYAGDFE